MKVSTSLQLHHVATYYYPSLTHPVSASNSMVEFFKKYSSHGCFQNPKLDLGKT